MARSSISTQDKSLLSIYEDIEVNSVAEQEFRYIIKSIVRKLIETMKKESTDFAELFCDVYHEDSNYIKSNSIDNSQKVELNLILEINGTKVEICGLGSKSQNPHLGFVKVLWPSIASMKISFNASDGYIYLSPCKIFQLIQTSCDSALTYLSNRMVIKGREYIINRSHNEKKPLSININESGACHSNMSNLIVLTNDADSNEFGANKDLNNNVSIAPMNCRIDIVPAIKFDFSYLPRYEGKWDRVYSFRNQFSSFHVRTFEAIPLKLNTSKPRFRISFLRLEKEMLKEYGCFEAIKKLFKHSNNKCFPLLNWYVVKAVMMWVVIERKHVQGHWKQENIEICFIDLMNELIARLDKKWIPDIFFTKFNRMGTLLGRKYYSSIEDGKYFEIKQLKHLSSTLKRLHAKLHAYQRGNTSISTFFSKD